MAKIDRQTALRDARDDKKIPAAGALRPSPLTVAQCREALTARADPAQAEHLSRFFRTGRGQYGEGDRFLGIKVPVTRAIAAQCGDTDPGLIAALLDDPYHEVRLLAGLLLERTYRKHKALRAEIVDIYLKNLPKFNNWDLVDLTCYGILGDWVSMRDRGVLYTLAASGNLWERRASIVSTMALIRRGELDDTFALAEKLLDSPEDLMHKAVGWLLREAGKKDRARLDAFLGAHYPRIPRTALRYAIEKHPEPERKAWLTRGK